MLDSTDATVLTETVAASETPKKIYETTLKDVVKAWNHVANRKGLPATRRFDDQRGLAFRRLVRHHPRFAKKQPWREYFKHLAKCPELNPPPADPNKPSIKADPTAFRATLDWALSVANFNKVRAKQFHCPEEIDVRRAYG